MHGIFFLCCFKNDTIYIKGQFWDGFEMALAPNFVRFRTNLAVSSDLTTITEKKEEVKGWDEAGQEAFASDDIVQTDLDDKKYRIDRLFMSGARVCRDRYILYSSVWKTVIDLRKTARSGLPNLQGKRFRKAHVTVLEESFISMRLY
jgi:hypothetical protein